MKSVSVIGMGMSLDTMTGEAMEAVKAADCLLGASRMLEEFAFLNKQSECAYLADDVVRIIAGSQADSFAVLFSGDVGFYSGATKLLPQLQSMGCEVKVCPGISSAIYFFARCGMPWQNANMISCHGLETDIVSSVRRNAVTFSLTGGNVRELAQNLCRAGYDTLRVHVGEKLSYPDEEIKVMTIRDLTEYDAVSLTVLIIENPAPDNRVRTGIPDEEFTRAKVPMTKSEVRAVCLSRLAIKPEDVCYDVGCGTGSVTVEMALAAWKGHVYAFDKKEEAVELTNQNCSLFHIGNVTAEAGLAPEVFKTAPTPDVVFIGGSSGNLRTIMGLLHDRNPECRFVVTAIALETLSEAIKGFEDIGQKASISQVSAARTKTIAGLHMMEAQNPIFIISSEV